MSDMRPTRQQRAETIRMHLHDAADHMSQLIAMDGKSYPEAAQDDRTKLLLQMAVDEGRKL